MAIIIIKKRFGTRTPPFPIYLLFLACAPCKMLITDTIILITYSRNWLYRRNSGLFVRSAMSFIFGARP